MQHREAHGLTEEDTQRILRAVAQLSYEDSGVVQVGSAYRGAVKGFRGDLWR